VINGIGAVATGIALIIIIVAKFIDGAWVTLIIVPGLMILFQRIRRHYRWIAREIERPIELQARQLKPPIVIIPINGWNRVSERALRFGLLLSDDVTAVHVSTGEEKHQRLRDLWDEKVLKPAREAKSCEPRLEIIKSPYRQVYDPILDFVSKVKEENGDRLIAVIIPELVEPHWYESLLHNQHGAGLKALLYLQGDERTVVINTPWYLKAESE